ncbi:mannose-binding protein C-like [Betta splendens]|uniref:Mannose-binding protein C-like n=1 Tax=Betta splendens TaxID=158456 RepID=A0A8M1HFR6_BETSP|nr:mannose-binding protein C-like [Betta splendens]
MRLCLLLCILCKFLDHQDHRDHKGHQELEGFQELQGHQELKGYEGFQELQENQDLLDLLDLLDLEDFKVREDVQDLQDLQDLKVFLDLLQCVEEDLEPLKEAVAKLDYVTTYDFVKRVGQKYFVSHRETGSFSGAVEFCSSQGLELALPQNEDENNMLTRVFGETVKTAWISVNHKKSEGDFTTDVKNRPLVFTKWAEEQPERSIQDTGCSLLSENGRWRVTRDCSQKAFIVCQVQ